MLNPHPVTSLLIWQRKEVALAMVVTTVVTVMVMAGGGGGWFAPLLVLFTLWEASLPATTDVTSAGQSAVTSLGGASTPVLLSCI